MLGAAHSALTDSSYANAAQRFARFVQHHPSLNRRDFSAFYRNQSYCNHGKTPTEMSSINAKKKRLRLHEVVQKICTIVPEQEHSPSMDEKEMQDVEKTVEKDLEKDDEKEEMEIDEVPVIQAGRRSGMHRFHLGKTLVPPQSPTVSEASTADTADESGSTEKDAVVEEEAIKEPSGPQKPLRCGVCDLRVFKSYRYISRTNAPNHLKNFFKPDVDRFRVCKRCFSSKEKCRKNLALVLLKSQTEQMSHVKTPLGITHSRSTRALQYLSRDMSNVWKRPYEDLLACNETLEDDDDISDADDTFIVTCEAKQPKIYPTSNGLDKSITDDGNFGLVTIVRPGNKTFQVYPNHHTVYGEFDDFKAGETGNDSAEPQGSQLENTEEVKVSFDPIKNGELKNEINSINEKLTLLDHAYALPAKSAKPPKAPKAPKPVDTETLKPKAKSADLSKPGNQPAKTVASPKPPVKTEGGTENKDGTGPVRTCGIVCTVCDNLVTKSYSCYKKDNAPEKIKHLFDGDVKVIKVCRRCLPYKKPKVEGAVPTKVVKSKGKVLQSKLLKQKIKKARKLKSLVKGDQEEISTQTKSISPKTEAKSSFKGDTKANILDSVCVKKDLVVVHNLKVTEGMQIPDATSLCGGTFEIVDGKLKAKTSSPAKTPVISAATSGSTIGKNISSPVKKPPGFISMVYKPIKIVNSTTSSIAEKIAKQEEKKEIKSVLDALKCDETLDSDDNTSSEEGGKSKQQTSAETNSVLVSGEDKANVQVTKKAILVTTPSVIKDDHTKPEGTDKTMVTETATAKADAHVQAYAPAKSDSAVKPDKSPQQQPQGAQQKTENNVNSPNTKATKPIASEDSSVVAMPAARPVTPKPVTPKPVTPKPVTPKPVTTRPVEAVRHSPRRDRGVVPPEKKRETSNSEKKKEVATAPTEKKKLPTAPNEKKKDANVIITDKKDNANVAVSDKKEANFNVSDKKKEADTNASDKNKDVDVITTSGDVATSANATLNKTKETNPSSVETNVPNDTITEKEEQKTINEKNSNEKAISLDTKEESDSQEKVGEAAQPESNKIEATASSDKKKDLAAEKVSKNVVTRKRPASSESESSGVVKAGEDSDGRPARKRPVRKGRPPKRLAEEEDDEKKKEGSVDSSDDIEGVDKVPLHSYSTRFTQAPVCCTCCKEKVVKSYRCVQQASSPAHLKPFFARENTTVLRTCRKCLSFPSRVKAYL
ncbi:uncharacterized protein LOC116619115 [Nematostella vectensis]|uniref:uncharacterized protein LOC116619115 n=1 Tax=Nematostella vectensis TaxID=45351 RepID=UPI0020771E9A|nr:uncharacterized protein LOC116619115 [Nematostella vectensis]